VQYAISAFLITEIPISLLSLLMSMIGIFAKYSTTILMNFHRQAEADLTMPIQKAFPLL